MRYDYLYIEGYLHHSPEVYVDAYTNQDYQQSLFRDFIQKLGIIDIQAALLKFQLESALYQNIEYMCNISRLNNYNDLNFCAEFMITCEQLPNLNQLYSQCTFKHFTLQRFWIQQNIEVPRYHVNTELVSTDTKKYNVKYIGERKIVQL